jgi:hypothetical protein
MIYLNAVGIEQWGIAKKMWNQRRWIMEKKEFIPWLRADFKNKIVCWVILGMFSTMTIGCAASGQTQVIKPVSGKLGKYKILALDTRDLSPPPPDPSSTDPDPSSTEPDDFSATPTQSSPVTDEEYLSLLDGLIIGKLRKMKLFEKVFSMRATVEKEYDLKVNTTITKSDTVHTIYRGLGGALAGQAAFEVDISLMDSKTGNIIGEAKAEGKSSAGHAYAGGTGQAVEFLADEIVGFIVQSH